MMTNIPELLVVILTLIIMGLLMIIYSQNKQSADKLGNSFPAETKNLLGILAFGMLKLADKTPGKVDDQATAALSQILKAMGVDVPELVKAGDPVAPVTKAPDIG